MVAGSLNNDYRIIDEFKTLVAFWLTDRYTEAEKKNGIQEIFNTIDMKIRMGSYEKVLESVKRIQRKYSKIYELNKDLFRGLKENLLEIEKRNRSSSRSSSSSSSSSSSNSSYNRSGGSNRSSGNYNNSSCFVATAAFGTKWADEIDVLRDWRDESLQYHKLGRTFIKFYYQVGPYLAKLVEKSSLLKKTTKKIIYTLIKRIDD